MLHNVGLRGIRARLRAVFSVQADAVIGGACEHAHTAPCLLSEVPASSSWSAMSPGGGGRAHCRCPLPRTRGPLPHRRGRPLGFVRVRTHLGEPLHQLRRSPRTRRPRAGTARVQRREGHRRQVLREVHHRRGRITPLLTERGVTPRPPSLGGGFNGLTRQLGLPLTGSLARPVRAGKTRPLVGASGFAVSRLRVSAGLR